MLLRFWSCFYWAPNLWRNILDAFFSHMLKKFIHQVDELFGGEDEVRDICQKGCPSCCPKLTIKEFTQKMNPVEMNAPVKLQLRTPIIVPPRRAPVYLWGLVMRPDFNFKNSSTHYTFPSCRQKKISLDALTLKSEMERDYTRGMVELMSRVASPEIMVDHFMTCRAGKCNVKKRQGFKYEDAVFTVNKTQECQVTCNMSSSNFNKVFQEQKNWNVLNFVYLATEIGPLMACWRKTNMTQLSNFRSFNVFNVLFQCYNRKSFVNMMNYWYQSCSAPCRTKCPKIEIQV